MIRQLLRPILFFLIGAGLLGVVMALFAADLIESDLVLIPTVITIGLIAGLALLVLIYICTGGSAARGFVTLGVTVLLVVAAQIALNIHSDSHRLTESTNPTAPDPAEQPPAAKQTPSPTPGKATTNKTNRRKNA